MVKKKLEFDDLSLVEKSVYLKAIENKVIDKDVFRTGMAEATEKAMEKGRKEGREIANKEGIIKALKRGKYTIEGIAEDFDVTIEFVLSIKEEIASTE